MHQEEHLDSDVESDIDDNTIPYHQYLLDSEVQDVPTEVSSTLPAEISMITILDDLRTQLDGHLKVNQEQGLVLTDKKKLEDKYLDESVCLRSAKSKLTSDLLQKFQMPTHTIPMLSKKPKNASQDLHKDILGRSNPRYGKKAPVINASNAWDTDETLASAERNCPKNRTTVKPSICVTPVGWIRKEFALQQVVPFLDYFKKHVQTANDIIVKEVAEFKEIHYALEDEYGRCVLDNKNLIIEKKNLLIKNDSLIAECLERDICSIMLYSDVAVTPISICSCDDLRLECDREHNKVLKLEAEISKQKRLITKSEKFKRYISGKDTHIRNLMLRSNHEVLNVGSTEVGTVSELEVLKLLSTAFRDHIRKYNNGGSTQRFGWVRFLRTKDETPHAIEKFIVKTQRALNATVRFVRTDNGMEFNGIVERRNRTLMEAPRTMLIFAKAPLFLWAEAVATACYTLNQSLVHTLHGIRPFMTAKGKEHLIYSTSEIIFFQSSPLSNGSSKLRLDEIGDVLKYNADAIRIFMLTQARFCRIHIIHRTVYRLKNSSLWTLKQDPRILKKFAFVTCTQNDTPRGAEASRLDEDKGGNANLILHISWYQAKPTDIMLLYAIKGSFVTLKEPVSRGSTLVCSISLDIGLLAVLSKKRGKVLPSSHTKKMNTSPIRMLLLCSILWECASQLRDYGFALTIYVALRESASQHTPMLGVKQMSHDISRKLQDESVSEFVGRTVADSSTERLQKQTQKPDFRRAVLYCMVIDHSRVSKTRVDFSRANTATGKELSKSVHS
ncbi:retrovirus-related pol polyprotein from transposon TNT 1-94 [Tanacetum coccineum]|uniref:Retrovirus-related pol polyprotein from transposon TNT 1-94 n=1 Tax=Tanacetum coccineum TaxID=301880 RepID=A0ABQ5AYC3_9ASTR